MSNNQKSLSNLPEPSTKFPVKPLLLVVLIIGLVTTYFLVKKNQQADTSPPVEASVVKPNYELLATDFFQGEIIKITGNIIKVETGEQEENPYLKNRIFEVLIGEQTAVFETQGPFFIIKNKESTEIKIDSNGSQDSLTKDLSIGDTVFILSFNDLKEKSSFIAREVHKINF